MTEHDDAEARIEQFRALRAKASRADELERENVGLCAEAAFRDSGLTLNEAQRDAVLGRLGDGEIDADAVRAAADELAFVPEPQVPVEEVAAHQRSHELTSDAPPADAHEVTLVDRINAARTPEELDGIMANAGLYTIHTG